MNGVTMIFLILTDSQRLHFFFFLMLRPPPSSPLFPYPPLFRSTLVHCTRLVSASARRRGSSGRTSGEYAAARSYVQCGACPSRATPRATIACSSGSDMRRDRKSTRLNSSHLVISYAVFCLKKKK